MEALKTQKKPSKRAQQALEFFQRLDRVEALAREEPPGGETRAAYTLRLRRQHSVPLLDASKAWLDEQAPQVPSEDRWAMPSDTRLTSGNISAVTLPTG